MPSSNPAHAHQRPKRPSKGATLLFIGLATAILVLDQSSKAWALSNLSAARDHEVQTCVPGPGGRAPLVRQPTQAIAILPSALELRYTENCGAAFGLLRTAPSAARVAVFGITTLLASIALALLFARGYGGRPFAIGASLIVGGALGNLADRVMHGYVVDFIRLYWSVDVPLLGREWPTMNVADLAIGAGVILLLFAQESQVEDAAPA